MKLQGYLRAGLQLAKEHTPLILASSAIGGVIGTAVLAARAHHSTASSLPDRESYSSRKAYITHYFKYGWKPYIPVIITGGLTIGCIVMMHRTHQKRYAALMGLYALGNQAFQEYRESVDEVLSEKDAEKVETRAAEKAVARDPEEIQRIHLQTEGAILCFDVFSGRYFKSSIETIRRAENDFNKGLIDHMYGTLNELYAMFGLEGIGAGEYVGWNSDKLVSIGYNSLLTPDGKPALTIDFHDSEPKHDYYR